MNSKHVIQMSVVVAMVAGLVSWPATGKASETVCGDIDEPAALYPARPDVEGPDISGASIVMFHVGEDQTGVSIDDCVYDLGLEALEVDFEDRDEVRLLFEFDLAFANATVLVTDESGWTEIYEVHDGSFLYTMSTQSSLDIQVAAPGPHGPVVPIVIRKPIDPK